MVRRVVLICGPPGAGKSTYARTLGLTVYDIDDPQWNLNEKVFRSALAQLSHHPNAQAAVIRSGATPSARAKAAKLVGATETKVIATPADECIRRVVERNRPRPPIRVQIAAVTSWWAKYQPGTTTAPLPKQSTTKRGYGRKHQKLRAQLAPKVEAGRYDCWRCGTPILPGQPWDLGHDDHDRSQYRGPEHRGRECPAGGNRATAGRQGKVSPDPTDRRWRL